MGVLRAMLSLPQYLMTAMFVGAEHVMQRRGSMTGPMAKGGLLSLLVPTNTTVVALVVCICLDMYHGRTHMAARG